MPEPGSMAALPPGPHAGGAVDFGSAQAILAGLSSPLAHAGLLPAAAASELALTTRDLPAFAEVGAAAWASAAASTLPAGVALTHQTQAELAVGGPTETMPAAPSTTSPHLSEVPAAAPLTPAWVTALQTPAPPRLGPPPQPVRERRQQRDDTGQGGHDDEVEALVSEPAEIETSGSPPAADTQAHAGATAWYTDLDMLLHPEVRAELSRRRHVLLVAPPGTGQRGLQLACLGFGSRGQPVCHRWAVRGAAAATDPDRDWQLWRVRREGDDGQRPVLTARATSLRQTAVGGLVLRVTATVLAPPLRPASHAWIDVLEPQRLWRDLGSQWTLLLAWSPQPLPLPLSKP